MGVINLMLDFLKSSLWPLTIIFLAWKFGPDIKILMNRLRKATIAGSGFELQGDAEKQSIQSTESSKKLVSDVLVEFPGQSRSKAITDLEIQLKKSLSSDVASGRIKNEDSVDFIINNLAVARLERHFEGVYRDIFGSQISAMYHIHSNGPQTVDQIRKFYDSAVGTEPEFYANYTFENWIDFLEKRSLVSIREGQVSISQDLFQFILAYRLPIEKRG
jgi:hypothetical protein